MAFDLRIAKAIRAFEKDSQEICRNFLCGIQTADDLACLRNAQRVLRMHAAILGDIIGQYLDPIHGRQQES